jgi:hypothetical protein
VAASTPAPPAVLAAGSGHGPAAGVVAGGAGGSVLLLLLAAAGAVLTMRRSLRRRRLATGGPDARIAGAWHEFTDALRLDGRPVPRHLAATEAAAFAAPSGETKPLRRATPPPAAPPDGPPAEGPPPDGSDPLPPLDQLVAGVNTSAFAPGAADPEQADRAGAQAVAYADALRARRSWWRRLWWSLHPGPLRW